MRALVACLLWLAGVEVMPAAHLAFHDHADHHHEGDQIVSDDHHADDHDEAEREITHDEADYPEHEHGGGGLAHHATALAPPAPPRTTPLPVDRTISFAVTEVTTSVARTIGFAPSARGPPQRTSQRLVASL